MFPLRSVLLCLLGQARGGQAFKTTVHGLKPKSSILKLQYSTTAAFPQTDTVMNVFDRKAKALHRDRAATKDNHQVFDYLREEVGYRVYDRILDIKRSFDVVVDLSAGKGYVGRNMTLDTCKKLVQCDISRELLARSERPEDTDVELKNYLVDEDKTLEGLPFDENSVDLVVSSLGLHWVNDLPGCFRNVWHVLKPDGAFIGAMFGGETLFELRCSLQMAELEREGGFAPHISPFVEMQDVGSVLNRTGYKMLTVDVDEIVVAYPTMFQLLEDLKGMAENNASWKRRLHLGRESLMAAASVYQTMYGQPHPDNPDEKSVPATFQIVYFIGWKPDKSQAKPAPRGSANASLQDIDKLMSGEHMTADKLDELAKNLKQTIDQTVTEKDPNDKDHHS